MPETYFKTNKKNSTFVKLSRKLKINDQAIDRVLRFAAAHHKVETENYAPTVEPRSEFCLVRLSPLDSDLNPQTLSYKISYFTEQITLVS